MMSALRRARELTAAERGLLLEALLLLVCVRVGLRLFSFTTLRDRLERRVLPEGCPVDRIVWAVNAMGRRVPGTNCLAGALVCHSMLRRHGHTPAFRIGVRRGHASALDAHAWVECEGSVVIGTMDAATDYAVLS
jgi:hypothetical protein